MRRTIRWIIGVILLAVFLFSGWQVISTLSEYRAGEESYAELTQTYVSQTKIAAAVEKEAEKPQEPLPAPVPEEPEAPPEEAAPVAVDFEALLERYPDVVGWIYCPDTPIHYPIVQAADNDYYLRRLLDGTWNHSGSIFLDHRCASDFSDWQSIVYGHNMNNDAMFGTFEEYKKQAYYDAHPALYLLTPSGSYEIALIGGYTTDGYDTETYAFADTAEERDALAEKARQLSTFRSETTVQSGDRIVTLSTCSYDFEDARYVLVGVLREMVGGAPAA